MYNFKKFSHGILQALLVVGLGMSLIGCSKGGSAGGSTEDIGNVDSLSSEAMLKLFNRNPHKCKQTNENCFSETFEQPVTSTRAVDVLFVVQTSTSIAGERQAIIAGLNEFINSLPANSDFNIGVMLAHGSTSAHSGVLYRAESEPIVLKSTELSAAQIQEHLTTKLMQVAQDPDSGGGEEGMFSLFRGITTPALLTESQAAGFFRPEAALGVVFIADRRDICAAIPAGVPEETDPVKIAARIRDCEGLTAAGLNSRLLSLKGSLPLAISGVLYADSPAPAGNEIGYGYLDVINLNGGVAVDIANDDISEGLASIAQLSGQQMEIQTEFTLSHTGIDPRRIIVTVNGVGATFELDGNKVTITSEVPAGAVVVISYCLKSEPSQKDKHKHKRHKHKKGKCKQKHHHHHHHDHDDQP